MAFDSFKGSLTSRQANAAAALGARRADSACEIEEITVADGGEGTLEALSDALGCRFYSCKAADATGKPIESVYGVSADGSTAVIETAATIGLPGVPRELRHPLELSSYGVGMQIKDAIARGCSTIIVCIGGTATVDAGVGMLRALGFRFLDANGNEVGNAPRCFGDIATIDTSGAPEGVNFIAFHDVKNPLLGPAGAAEVFGPQKGATPDDVKKLDDLLRHVVRTAENYGLADETGYPGAGAGGGIGYALRAFLHADMRAGAEAVLSLSRFRSAISGARTVFTGEGRVDRSTLYGKTPMGVLNIAKEAGVPVFAVGGSVDGREGLLSAGFVDVVEMVPQGQAHEVAMLTQTAEDNLANAVERLVREMEEKLE